MQRCDGPTHRPTGRMDGKWFLILCLLTHCLHKILCRPAVVGSEAQICYGLLRPLAMNSAVFVKYKGPDNICAVRINNTYPLSQ